MDANALNPRSWTRRKAIVLAMLPLAVGLDSGLCRAADQTAILMVSRKRLLNDTAHARALLRAENELTAELQRRVDAVKAALTAEEQELALLRATLDREAFDIRASEFDRNVRSQRREAQQHAAVLQNSFRVERLKLIEALGPLLEEARIAHGATVILNSDQALAADPVLYITDETIARFDATVAPPTIPGLDAFSPVQVPDPRQVPEGDPLPQ